MKMNFIFNFARPQEGSVAMRRRLVVLAFVGLAVVSAPPVGAQDTLAVEGTVVDSTGAAVPEARVVLRREPVGFEAAVRTDGSGRFRVAVPRAGDYELAVEGAGFSVARRPLAVAEGVVEPVRVTLRPGVFSERVEVVGTRLADGPETLRRIPGSIEVLSSEMLEGARVFNVSEALRKASGVHVRDEEGFGLRPNIGIRGLNPTRSAKTLLLEDGLPLAFAPYGDNASYYHPPIERFDSVEILKGSGQIAYGPVTVGGVVNYITPGPPAKPSANLRLSGGNRGYFNGHGQLGGTWGATGLLLDYMHKEGDGSRANVHSNLDDANLKAVFSMGARQTLTLKGNLYAEDSQITYSGLREAEYEADPRGNVFANDTFSGRRYGASARHALVVGDQALLTTQLYASRFSRDWWRQSSNSGQRPNDSADPSCGGLVNLNTTCGNEGRLRDYDHAGIEPRLRFGHHLFGAASEAEVGLRGHFEVQERIQQNGDTPTARSGRTVEDNRRTNEAYSAFAQNRLLLGRLTVTPGIRLETIDYERTNRLAGGGAGISGRTDVTQWVPGVGLVWSADARASVFAGVHRGFAPPRTEDIVNNTTGGAVELDPELSWNYEAGVRTQPRPGVRLDATAFRMDYENQIVPASLAGGLGATLTNGGRTLHQGLELTGRVDAGTITGSDHNVFLRAAFTALPTARFEGTRFSNVPGSSTVSVSGNRLPYAPERMLTAAVGYAHARGATALLEAVHVSEQFADDLNSLASSADGQRGLIPGYTIWNASLAYELRALRSTVFVAVKNASDRLYIVDRARGILPGPPRLVQAGLQARF
jgi:Fe(3+) dicitrate transport protein